MPLILHEGGSGRWISIEKPCVEKKKTTERKGIQKSMRDLGTVSPKWMSIKFLPSEPRQKNKSQKG